MPSQIVRLGHKMLSFDLAYDAYQWAVGGKAYRDRLVESVSKGNEVVLDLGCGTAASATRLNSQNKYFGVDLSQKYISKAQNRILPCKTTRFIVDNLMNNSWQTEYQEFAKGEASLILALGVFHHLNDAQSLNLLTNLRNISSINSVFFSVDPTVNRCSTVAARWFANNDRGKFIRTPDELGSLFARAGYEADICVKTRQFRIPLDTVEILARVT